LHISYPSAADQQKARSMGQSPGGAIMIHGLARPFAYLGPLHRETDWTDGCIAVTNAEIEEIWKLVPVGTRVEIRARSFFDLIQRFFSTSSGFSELGFSCEPQTRHVANLEIDIFHAFEKIFFSAGLIFSNRYYKVP
jgi:hypothetical protein